jgi:hypothetical protein
MPGGSVTGGATRQSGAATHPLTTAAPRREPRRHRAQMSHPGADRAGWPPTQDERQIRVSAARLREVVADDRWPLGSGSAGSGPGDGDCLSWEKRDPWRAGPRSCPGWIGTAAPASGRQTRRAAGPDGDLPDPRGQHCGRPAGRRDVVLGLWHYWYWPTRPRQSAPYSMPAPSASMSPRSGHCAWSSAVSWPWTLTSAATWPHGSCPPTADSVRG